VIDCLLGNYLSEVTSTGRVQNFFALHGKACFAMSSMHSLRADEMPASRNILRYVKLSYETDEDGSDVLVVDPKAITEDERCLLRYGDVPQPRSKVLLHSCCAPCSGAMVEECWFKMNLDVTIFFYNPNIHPKREYEIRKEENKKYAIKHGIPFVDCDYDAESWYQRMTGFELEPERGVRCSSCFDMRMEVTIMYAFENGFQYFTTTNATSRWKDETQVNLAGIRAVDFLVNHLGKGENKDSCENERVGKDKVTEVAVDRDALPKFWVYDWKTDAFTRRKYEVSVDEKFYKQEYCGCAYSLRDSNIWRAQQGIDPVRIGGEKAGLGSRYFEDVEIDEQEESQAVVDQFFNDANNAFGDSKRVVKQQKKLETVFQDRMKSADNVDLNNW
jgi:epoxyqueuosine reductase